MFSGIKQAKNSQFKSLVYRYFPSIHYIPTNRGS